MQTKEGAIKAKQTNLERHGDDFFKMLGSRGGRAKTSKPKGFAANRDLARTAGAKGGSVSRRGVEYIPLEERIWNAVKLYKEGHTKSYICKTIHMSHTTLNEIVDNLDN